MNRETHRCLEEYRRNEAGPLENTLIDEFLSGEMDRRELLRRGSVFGLSLSMIGALLAAGGEPPLAFAENTVKIGGRLRVGQIPGPGGVIEPYRDLTGSGTSSICGEFLTRATATKRLLPELAVSWRPNAHATVWTFKLRPNVKFHSGQTMTADDVVTTWKRLASPGSQALSAVGKYLKPRGVVKVDRLTVAFHLESPVSNFPYLVSSETYQSIILPADYRIGTFASKPQCTGAFMLTSYRPGVGATFERFTHWWGGRAPLDGVDVTYYSANAAADAALLGRQIDLLTGNIQLATDRPLFNNRNVRIFTARAAAHRQVPMRVDMNNPFHDHRVRQAVALTLDRPAIIKTLFNNRADIGNDSPFAPVYGLARGVPQRKKNIRRAKQLMAAAGHPHGFRITLTTEQVAELPELAQIIQRAVRAIGIQMKLNVLSVNTYYNSGTQTGPPKGWGTTPWLNTPINITDWGSRPVPNVYLTSGLGTKGVWNAAHYSNKRFDALVKSFLASTSFKDENRYATKIAEILLHDTPVIFPYFYYSLAAGSKRVRGFKTDPLGDNYLSRTWLA